MARRNSTETKVFPGVRFGRLIVLERLPKEYDGSGKRAIHRARCRCDCGNESSPLINCLIQGRTTSCGCRKKETGKENAKAQMRPDKGMGRIVVGARFGRWEVIHPEITTGEKRNKALCRCECGVIDYVARADLANNESSSCGCGTAEKIGDRNKRHARLKGASVDPELVLTYQSWASMISRCYTPKQTHYEYYGGRGIVVCERVRESPQALVDLIGARPDLEHSLDRHPDNNGNYSCGECPECIEKGWKFNLRWATRKQQCRNKSNNSYLTAFGVTATFAEWEEWSGIDNRLLHGRIKQLGWSPEKAVSTPDGVGNCYLPE